MSDKPTSHLYLAYSYNREINRELERTPKGRALMPKATIDIGYTEHKPLKTLPDGFVELKRMSYGEYLKRRDMISNMSFKGEGKNTQAFMEMANEAVAQYEFQTCIVDHNLEDENGKLLDFRKKTAFQYLDPRIGEEISSYIDEMNQWEKDGDEDNGPLPDSGDTSDQ